MNVAVHESVDAVFPPERMVEALASVDGEVGVVGDDPVALGAYDGVVTFEHRDSFLETVDWVHSIQAGVDRFPRDEFRESGVVLFNSSGIHGDSVGETVVGFMTALARGLHRYRSAQEDGEWISLPWDRPFTVADEAVCVVGLGTIGQAVAERATWMGMDIQGVRRSPDPVPIVDEVYSDGELHKALVDARFVVLAAPLTAETRRMIGPAELAAMSEDAYLINVGRGGLVVEDALVAALENGEIAGVALDVFQEEPLPADSPLWDHDDVIVTPHSAALTRDYYEDVAEIVRENVDRMAEELEPRNCVIGADGIAE